MGLISSIKDFLNDHKLEKAEKFLQDGKREKGEQLLCSILDKHPQAVVKLAEHYHTLAKQASVREMVRLFSETISLEKKGGGVYDVKSYDIALKAFSKDIIDRAKKSFESKSYIDCRALLSPVNSSKCKTDASNKLESEAQINIFLKEIESVKSTAQRFNSLIDEFKTEWVVVKKVVRAKETVEAFCDRLINSKRYYTSTLLLDVIQTDNQNIKILDNVRQIIIGNDIEASASQIKDIISIHGTDVVLRKDITTEEAVSLFDDGWKTSKDSKFVMGALLLSYDAPLLNALISKILDKHKLYFADSDLYDEFSKWVYEKFEPARSLQLLEQLYSLGYDTERYYIDKLRSWISSMTCDEKIKHLDHAQALFSKSKQIHEEKFNCAKWYLSEHENEKAIAVADTIIDFYDQARAIKAGAMCDLARLESDADKQVALLRQANTALGDGHENEFNNVRDTIRFRLLSSAESFYNSKNFDKAYEILHELSAAGFDNALFAIANYRLNEIRECSSIEENLNRIKAAIEEIRKYNNPTITQCSEYSLIWDEYLSTFIDSRASADNNSAVKDFEALLEEVENAKFDKAETKKKKAVVTKQIINRKYLIARECEISDGIEDACRLYKEINKLEATRTPTLSALRFIICKLKLWNYSEILGHKDNIYSFLRNAAVAFKAEKNDIAYRLSLALLKAGEDKEALSVLSEFLPDEDYLRKACEQGAMIKAQAKLGDLNNKLEAVRNRTLSSDDAIYLVNHIREYGDVIEPVLSIPLNTLKTYRNNLKNYAIFKLFEEEKFAVAFGKMLKEHPDYLDDMTALRNIAIVCLNMAEAKQISDENYKEVISVWLTAIYQERLFIKSLDYTSWDDKFTFSLDEAYGHFNEYTVGDLPDNVNFNNEYEDDGKLVFIREVQRTLLDRFEAAIGDVQTYHDFFTAQKDAMDKFVALNLDEKCRLVAPFIAKKDDSVFKGICDALEQDREQKYDNWEDVIAVGALYQVDEQIYTDYSDAKAYYQACMNSLDSMVVTSAKQAFTSGKVSLISDFDKLHSALISKAKSNVAALSANNMAAFKKDFNFFMVVCNAIKDNTLSFIFSKYVMHFVVREVNEKRLSLTNAADFILSVYLLDPSNSKVQENLSALFEMLVREDDSLEKTQAVNGILNKVRTVSVSLYRQFYKEKEDAEVDAVLNDIVAKVNNNTMSRSSALNKVYEVYTNNPNNARVCGNLAQLCSMCVVEYVIGQKSGYTSVQRILDSLKTNKSDEFKKHGSVFREAYNGIWNQLPSNSQMLIQLGGRVGDTSLNEAGYALKRGLEYLEILGGFTGAGSKSVYDRFHGLFDF